jgi:hypothetical protein
MRKAYLLVLTLFVIIATGMLAPTLVTAQYWIPCTGPVIAVELPNATQDMNVTDTHPYAIGDSFNVTVWINNATLFDGIGLTIIWNSTFEVMTAFYLSPKMAAEKLAGNWTFSPVSWSNNATLMPSEPWTGVLPYNVGVLNDLGGGTMADIADLSGNIEMCILQFKITQIGPHGFYINKDPSLYSAPYPIELATEVSVPPQYALPFSEVYEYVSGVTETSVDYGVSWSTNPYFAPPTPYSGHLANAMLWTTTGVIPEFPAFMPLLLFLIVTIIAVALAKIMWTKKPKRPR